MDARGAEERKMDAGEAGEREMEVEPRLASGRSRMLVEHRLSGAHFASLDACARAPAEVLGAKEWHGNRMFLKCRIADLVLDASAAGEKGGSRRRARSTRSHTHAQAEEAPPGELPVRRASPRAATSPRCDPPIPAPPLLRCPLVASRSPTTRSISGSAGPGLTRACLMRRPPSLTDAEGHAGGRGARATARRAALRDGRWEGRHRCF
jgi:hypothetical protein